MCAFSPATIPSSGDSFPATWTVAASGALNITLLVDGTPLTLQQAAGATASAFVVKDGDGDTVLAVGPTAAVLGTTDALPTGVTVQTSGTKLWGDANNDANYVVHVKAGDKIGFFGTAPVAKPTGVAVTAPAIHAALVTLGLIAA